MTSLHGGSRRPATCETATSPCQLVCGRALVIVPLAGLLIGALHGAALAQSSFGLTFRDALAITRQRNERWRAADASVWRAEAVRGEQLALYWPTGSRCGVRPSRLSIGTWRTPTVSGQQDRSLELRSCGRKWLTRRRIATTRR